MTLVDSKGVPIKAAVKNKNEHGLIQERRLQLFRENIAKTCEQWLKDAADQTDSEKRWSYLAGIEKLIGISEKAKTMFEDV